jgi:hypothetical protein
MGVAAGLFRVARVLYLIYTELQIFRGEHRMLMDDLWERHPDKKDDFYIAMGQEQRRKAFFYTGRR